MPQISCCPDAQTLENLVLGLVDASTVEALEQHVAQCAHCAETLGSLKGEDVLVAAMRRARERDITTPLAESISPWLKRLRPDDVTTTFPPGSQAGPAEVGPSSRLEFLAPAQQPDELGRLGPYRVCKLLGAGGMGMVFLAEDPRLRRSIALKVIRPELLAREDMRQRFLREARAIAAIEHENIILIHEVNEAQGVLYLAMPLLRGETLEERLKRERLSVDELLRVAQEVAQGVAAAHARGLVHRDIKPSNIWLETKDEAGRTREEASGLTSPRVKVLDFGLARVMDEATAPAPDSAALQTEQTALPTVDQLRPHVTQAGTLAGTPAYMSPEQLRGEAVDARSDLFSLGSVLYRMATGSLAFEARSVLTTLVAVAFQQPLPACEVNPKLPRELSDLIMRLLAKSPGDRFQTAEEVVQALQQMRDRRAEARWPKPARWRWWLVTATAMLAAVGLTLWLRPWAAAPLPPEEPGEVALVFDEPDQRLILRAPHSTGEAAEQQLDLKLGGKHTLPPGEYSIRPLVETPNRHLWPDHFQIKSGERTDVTLRLVGEIRQMKGHTQPIGALAVSPRKGELLALTAGQDRSVGLWDALKDEQMTWLDGHQSPVRCVAFSADGRLAASGSGDRGKRADLSIRLWDLSRRLESACLLGHESWVTAVAFSPDGKRLLSGGDDGQVLLWDLAQGRPLLELKGHERLTVHGAAYTADGARALTCGADNLVLLWDVAQGKLLKKLEGHTGSVRGMAALPDGRSAVSVSLDGTIRIWDSQTGAAQGISPQQGALHAVAVSPDGKRILTGGVDGSVRLWEVAGGKQIHSFSGHQGAVHGVAFSADGRKAVSAGADRTVRLWELPQ